jgi:large subunit ribosomal protein L22
MAYAAKHRFAPISARKARLVLDMIRGMPLEEALSVLTYSKKRAAAVVRKVVESARANALDLGEDQPGELYVSRAWADEGPTRTKWRPRARGMASPINQRRSHINIELDTLVAESLNE